MKSERSRSDFVAADASLLSKIHFIRYGTWLESDHDAPDLFDDLCSYRTVAVREKRPCVSIPAIRGWLLKPGRKSTPKRDDAIAFLCGYLRWIERQGFVPDDERKAAIKTVIESVGEPDEAALSDESQTDRPASDGFGQDAFLKIIRNIIDVGAYARASETTHFWGGDDADDPVSYYLIYRLSTIYGTILKSFMEVKKAARSLTGCVFNHYVWGSDIREHHSTTFRECEGVIFKLSQAYYFVGYNYTVPADKRNGRNLYMRHRTSARKQPNGIDVIAVEYPDITHENGLFGGLTISVAASGQPVAGRVAFLHLGTKAALGCEISDELTEPNELVPTELENDLRATVGRLMKAGCKKFGSDLNRRMRLPEWESNEMSKLAKRIACLIDNKPAWVEKGKRHGAIETFGTGAKLRAARN